MNNLKYLSDKTPFDSSLNPKYFTLAIKNLNNISNIELSIIISLFNKYGVVLIKQENKNTFDAESLKKYFGEVSFHKKANQNGVVEISCRNPNSEYLHTSNEYFPLHTDGAYSEFPEGIVTIYCNMPAEEGGETIIASGKLAYEFVKRKYSQQIVNLFLSDALTIERDCESSTKPIFMKLNEKRVAIRYRMDGVARIIPNLNSKQIYKELSYFFANPQNIVTFKITSGDLLVIDNFSVLHGRKSFNQGANRLFYRLNFVGKNLKNGLLLGFQP